MAKTWVTNADDVKRLVQRLRTLDLPRNGESDVKRNHHVNVLMKYVETHVLIQNLICERRDETGNFKLSQML